MAATKKTAKTARKSAKTSERRSLSKLSTKKSREGMVIVSVLPNPRLKGSISYKNYEAMAKFVKGKRNGVKVAELIAETNYRVEDFNSDLAHEYIKVRKG